MTKPLDSQPVKAGKDYWECCAADGVTAALDFVHASDSRDASHEWLHLDTLADEVRWLRKERDLFRTASEAAELRIVELREQVTIMGASLKKQDEAVAKLQTDDWKLRQDLKTASENAVEFQVTSNALRAKLARVEAIISAIDPRLPITARREAIESIRAALRDEPQPEREPKLPFNGY